MSTKQDNRAEVIACCAIIILAAILMFLQACGGAPLPPPGPPIPNNADAIEQCDAICLRLDVLGCEGRDGNIGPDGVSNTDDDATCERACVDTMQVIALNADCIVAATSCDAVDDCEVE